MSKYIIMSDLHAHNYKQFNSDNQRLENCLSVLEDCFILAHEKGAEHILFAGDLYDAQKAIPTIVVNKVIQKFDYLFNKYPGIDFVAISGNHDYATKNLLDKPAVTALTHLDEIFGGFILIDNQTLTLESGVTISGVPYYEYQDHYHTMLEQRTFEIDPADHNILLVHQTPDNISNTSIPADTDPESHLYGYFNQTFCGHIHKREILTNKFMLVGSPLHRDQGDIGQDKGILIYDTDATNEALMPGEVEFIGLNYPQFMRVEEDDPAYADDYAIVAAKVGIIEDAQDLEVRKFNTDLKAEELLTNYWEEAGEGDGDLLQVGLSFLK